MADAATKTGRTLDITDEVVPSIVETELNQEGSVATASRLWLFWSHRVTIFRAGIAGLIISTVVAFLIPKRYESVARLMPPDQSSSSATMLAAVAGGLAGGRGSGLGSLAGDLLGMKNTGELFVGVLQSATVEDAVINEFDLRKEYGDRLIEDARKDLEKKTDISMDRKSQIISIAVTDYDPKKATAMADEYVKELNRVVVKLNTSSASREREFLESRLAQVKADLEAAERGFSEFASKNTAIDIPAQGKAMIEAAATVEGQLIATQTELESLRQVYTENNVRVRASQARVQELKRQLQKLGGSPGGAPLSEAGSNDQSIPSIRQLPLLGVPYADLFRNTRVQEAIFETLTEEYELAKVQEAKETPSVKVLDAPGVPEKKSFPPRFAIGFLGTVLFCSVALIWVSMKTAWQSADVADPRKILALEVVAAVRRRIRRRWNGL